MGACRVLDCSSIDDMLGLADLSFKKESDQDELLVSFYHERAGGMRGGYGQHYFEEQNCSFPLS